MKIFAAVLAVIAVVNADIYMHNPRGSNNRLDENGRERNNGNRMFDSQNNNRGGYNVGSLYYTAGSVLPIEWTNQHSCGDPNANCELVMQYMCGEWVRDGTTTTTIPENPNQCYNYDCNTDIRYGMNENFDNYLNCKIRQREANLFTADQNLNGETARYTRQNPQGTRRGYECPEERDHYPYWGPTPWMDIAVFTNDAERCEYYQTESQNVKSRWACDLPFSYLQENRNANRNRPVIPITKEACEAVEIENAAGGNATFGVWKEYASFNMSAPACRENHWSRDNHLGNGVNGQPNTYNWTIPETLSESCVLRIRYNISTGEFDGWDGSTTAELNAEGNQESTLDVYTRYGLTAEEAEDRGYVFENNPNVEMFTDAANGDNFNLQLAINTAQLGRTFQDRSHTFAIRAKPAEVAANTVYNLNVRGKRGNIVQVFPGVEYDFVPNNLEMMPGDFVHPQWTGSNSNPNNNDGQGRQGTDRSNIALLKEQNYEEGTGAYYEPFGVSGQYGNSYPKHLADTSFVGLAAQTLINMAVLQPGQFRGEMSELDDAGTYFDAKPLKVTETGTHHYMCTRNNNFSNRSQKGRMKVGVEQTAYSAIGYTGGNVTTSHSELNFGRGSLDHLEDIKVVEWDPQQGKWEIERVDGSPDDIPGDKIESNFVTIYPTGQITTADETFTLRLFLNGSTSDVVELFRSDPESFTTWEKVEFSRQGNALAVETQSGGTYVATGSSNAGQIAGIVIGCIAAAVLIIGAVVYFRMHPEKLTNLTKSGPV
ncbi:protein DD3-3 [Strongylocentrotus purpuratus]|uniref:Protein DD3-3 n=1 Tax=Strongylocentrotus purpuratus TaxID=7668 RepID=A0A7M7RJ32_STRPU|nr:protein DD3-3 [Strongylocentrotus purpuratus]|eukprot:XP_801877.1 PREDICTED: protein DD3-3 [Strongylocentrotus purpuratus]